MTTPRLQSEEQSSDDEQNVSAVHPISAPHPVIERSTLITDESDFATYLSYSTLVDEEAQSHDSRSSLPPRQTTTSPDNSTPEAEQSPLLSEHPSNGELPTNEAHSFLHQAFVSVNTEGHASGGTLRSREEPLPDDTTSQSSSVPAGNHQNLEWIPYTLRWQSLTILVISTVILLSLVVALWWRSVVNNGIGTDDGSSMLLFGWRFTPPLLAVLYVQMTAMLLDDVKRTECFARMARSGGASAASSILRAPGAWWNALADGLSKHGGHRRWLLFSTACLNIIGFLAISPLSSSFLELAEVMVTSEVEFTRMTPQQRITPVSSRETKLRIVTHLLQNISTSAWISENYTILPFWPSTFADTALGPELPGPFQTWQAETWVLSTELDCHPLSLVNVTGEPDFVTYAGDMAWKLELSSGGKCKYTISTISDEFFGWYNALMLEPNVQHSKECEDTELILVVMEVRVARKGTGFSGHACSSKYYMAEIVATAQISDTDSSVVFDEKEYLKKRRPMPSSFLNTDEIQNISLAESWCDYVSLIAGNVGPFIKSGDLFPLLYATYNFDLEAIVDDKTLISRAEKVKQEVFAETLHYSLQTHGASTDNVSGKATKIESRVVVAAGVSIALVSFLWISLFLEMVIWSLSRIRVRPLNLKEDPATITGIAALIVPGSETHINLRKLKHDFQALIQPIIEKKQFHTTYSRLHELNFVLEIPEVEEGGNPKNSDWRPLVLRLRTLLTLGLYLATLVTAILVLHHFAQRSSLYRTAFVYQATIPVFGIHTLAPFSLLPTLLAVLVGLWWGSIDVTFRRLQPYLSMVEAPQPLVRGANLSYQSSYWLRASFKAALNQHWLLLLVTVGTSLSPILTIVMSALLERVQTNISTQHQALRDLELRHIPHLFYHNNLGMEDGYVTSEIIYDLYENLSTNWLYSATLQLTMGGSEPPWSQDGWSFTPIDLTQFLDRSQKTDPSTPDLATNVSIITPSIRGRLKCSPYENLDNTSAWLTFQEFGNKSQWDASTIPHDIKSAYQPGHLKDGKVWPYFFDTWYLCRESRPTCCTNGSSWPPPASALGRWSANEDIHENLLPPFNITAKWIYGPFVSGLTRVDDEAEYDAEYGVFLEIPSVQALDCTPIIERSSALVTVNQISGNVKDFSILEEPEEASEAWAHNFIVHRNDDYSNITVSYGILFLKSLLHAASLTAPYNPGEFPRSEPLSDQTFTFRDTDHGLNLDFMTYAMYALVGKDPEALLDIHKLEATAQQTFTTFFQHFVSSNVLLDMGINRTYQPINVTLPSCLAWNDTTQTCMEQPSVWSVSHTSRTVEAQTWTRATVLQMNAVAVWLSVGILAWLIATTVVVAAAMNRHLRGLKGDVERVADVLLMVAGSDKLLRLLKERGERELVEEEVMTKLGWFEDRDGQLRWGIEVVEGENESGDD